MPIFLAVSLSMMNEQKRLLSSFISIFVRQKELNNCFQKQVFNSALTYTSCLNHIEHIYKAKDHYKFPSVR